MGKKGCSEFSNETFLWTTSIISNYNVTNQANIDCDIIPSQEITRTESIIVIRLGTKFPNLRSKSKTKAKLDPPTEGTYKKPNLHKRNDKITRGEYEDIVDIRWIK